MDLSSLSNQELWHSTGRCVGSEREFTIDTIVHLTEIQRRHAFADFFYSSLWAALRKHFRYDNGCAQRRVNVVNMLRARPELEEKLRSGVVSFSNLSAVQTCINGNAMTEETTEQLLKNIENKSTTEAEREIAKIAPKPLPRDKEKPLDANHTLASYVLDNETIELLNQVKAERSHANPSMSMNETLKFMAKTTLAKISKARETKCKAKPTPPPPLVWKPLTEAQKRPIFRRDGSRCTEPGCGSTYQIQVDHITPPNFGGTNDPGNLRCLCRTHNMMQAKRWYGDAKMEQYMCH